MWLTVKPNKNGVEIDLLFDRADNVVVIIEAKYQAGKIYSGMNVVEAVRRKEERLRQLTHKTIQKVITRTSAAKP